MRIDFVPAKREVALEHRDLDIAEADRVFEAPHITFEGVGFSFGETRFFDARFAARPYRSAGLDTTRRRDPRHQHEESQ